MLQQGFGDNRRRFSGAIPAPLALVALGPGFALFGDLKRIDLDLAGFARSVLVVLDVAIVADRRLLDFAFDTSLFQCLERRAGRGRHALHRPALRNDPAPGAPRSHEQNLQATARYAIGQRGILDTARLLGYGGTPCSNVGPHPTIPNR